MFGLTLTDWIVLAIYLIGTTLIGVWAARKVKSAASYFISDRKSGIWLMLFYNFGTGTHSDQAVSVAAKTYHAGASGIWYQWLWLFATPFYWLIAPLFRRMRAVTTADYFEARYDRSVSLLFAVIGILQMMVNIGVMLKGSSAMITAVSGGSINPDVAILATTVIFVIYGVAGGLNAAIVTDLIQGILTVLFSFLLLPLALFQVGGMEGLRAKISDPAMFEIVAPGEINTFFIVVIAINALVGIVTQPHTMGMCSAGKTEFEGRFGWTAGSFLKRVCTIAWVLTGLCAVAMYMGQDIDVDQVYGLMAHDLLPGIGLGLVGLFIASMLAALMSSCDAFMVTSAALFTENIYRKVIVKNKQDKHYILVGRVASLVVVACGILFAFSMTSVVSGLEMFWKVAAMMGIAFWIGLFWRRATVAGAWAATLASFAVYLFTSSITILDHTLWDFDARFAQMLPGFMLWDGGLYLPWQIIMYLTVGLVTLFVVSLVSRPVDEAKLEQFYVCLRTPVRQQEPEVAPFTLPETISPAPRRLLFGRFGFEIPMPTMLSITGFIVAWCLIGSLMAAFFWILA